MSRIIKWVGDSEEEAVGDEEKAALPEDSQPIILVTSKGFSSQGEILTQLMERKKGVFGKVVQHTTRSRQDDEVDGKDFNFVDTKAFNQILDGDYFLETIERDGAEYGTNRKVADAIMENGKVPVIELDREVCLMFHDHKCPEERLTIVV